MKTLILTLEYPPQVGGIATYVHNVASHLPPTDVAVYAMPGSGEKELDARTPWPVFRRAPFWPVFIWPRWTRAFLQAGKIIKRFQPDIIHVHHVLPMGYVARLVKKWRKIPYVVFLHGSDMEFAAKNKMKLKKFRCLCRDAQSVVVNSEYMRGRLMRLAEGLDNIKIVYPCPSDEFLVQSPNEKEMNRIRAELALAGKKVIISVSRLVERKGHVRFVPALAKILEKVPNAVWLIVGDGPEKPELVQLIQKYNLQGAVRFLSTISLAQLPLYYRLSDVFVLLTHKDKDDVEEAWGTVFLEAAAAGLPVVAGRSGGVAETMENMVTGVMVDVSHMDGVVSTVADLLARPDYARQMGAAGRARVLREFTWEKQITKLK